MKIKEENYKKGKFGEDEAKTYLENMGYGWIESNYSNKIGEVDLVMTDNDWLVFVEVKYKSDDRRGKPEEMINKNKLSQVKRVAESYVFLKKPKQEKYRIDAVCILGKEIRHYKNIY
jgi:putative endonuclease